MAINGLDKITDKILAEAQGEADRIIADAEAECARISEDFAKRAAQIKETLSAEAEREATDTVARAKAAAENRRRNLLLSARAKALDEVFDTTLAWVRKLDAEKYTDVLVGLLSAALIEQEAAERDSRTLYGEEDALAPDAYEVILNTRDRDRYGKEVLSRVRTKLAGKLPEGFLAKVVLSDRTVSIDGGLVLRCGNVESNCSLDLLFAELRSELESEVSHALFPEETGR